VIGFSLAGSRTLKVQVQHDASAGGMAWTPLPLANGWTNYGAGYAPAQYVRLPSGLVVVQGLIAPGTLTDGTTVATLPASYRPAASLEFLTKTSTTTQSFTVFDVLTSGALNIYHAAGAVNVALFGISFPAEA